MRRESQKSVGLVGIILSAFVGMVIFNAVTQGEQTKRAETSKPPEQRVAEEKDRVLSSQRSAVTLVALSTIKKHLRNPASVQWGNVLANDDGSVVCIEYRAQNGFGGMNLSKTAIIKGVVTTTAADWNKNCAGKQLNDVSLAVRYLD